MITSRLDDVCEVVMGQAPKGDTYNDLDLGVPLVAGAGDIKEGCVVPTKFTTVPTRLSRREDVIIGIRASIGTRASAPFAVCLGRGVAALRPGPGLHHDYLWHWVGAAAPRLAAKGRGATFLQVNREDIGGMPIALPPLDEQRRVARILDAADALRRSRARTVAISATLAVASFREVCVPNGERTMTVGELVDREHGGIRTGPFGSQLLHGEFVDSGIAVLGIDNVVANEFRWGRPRYVSEDKYRSLARYTVNPGDVLITIMGTCGHVAVVPSDVPTAINTKHLCCITLDQSLCLPDFLHAYFLHDPTARSYLESRAKGAIMSGLNMAIVRELPVRLPSLDIQREFVGRAHKARSLSEAQSRHLAHLDALFASLQHRAFTGAL